MITNIKDNRKPRPLYDIPYMFEAREFLRKKLIGKKVRASFDKENVLSLCAVVQPPAVPQIGV